MHLVESAPFKKGSTKMYSGVPGNLVAFACKLSFQRGHEGNVSFISKTQLIAHYEKTLGAMHFGGRVMIIETPSALKLINRYFKTNSMKAKKTKKTELDVDYIGGQDPLTPEEEKALSDFFKKRKTESKNVSASSKAKTTKSNLRQSPRQ